MKIFILKSKTAVYIHHTIFETKEFWIAPVHNSNNFDLYGKDVFKLTIEEVKEKK